MEGRSADVIVAGLGIMGSAAAHAVAERGLQVLGLEAGSPAHALGSSHGPTRIIRHATEESPGYVPIVTDAFARWHALEEATDRTLLTLCGALRFGHHETALLDMVRTSAAAAGLPVEELTADAVQERFPGFRLPPDFAAVYEEHAGVVHAAAALGAFHDRTRALGGALCFDEPVLAWQANGDGVEVRTTCGTYTAGRLVLAAGPWMTRLVPELALPLEVQRVVNVTFGPLDPTLYGPDRCPSFIGMQGEEGFYGCPMVLGEGVKVGGGEVAVDPDRVRREVAAADIEPIREFVERFLPAAGGPVTGAVTCLYTSTPDGHFIIDRHPEHASVVIASPCSGHGFKHASAIGPILADLAVDGTTDHDIDFLRIDRPFGAPATAWRRPRDED